ncbi:50S ribosomal protein L32e [Candidatus Woesearchaeota archaeon]|nr:50S ribosomal protein L32e [Candidatus Woesearchaeota archaeon]
MKDLLEKRKEQKKKKPRFIMQSAHKLKRLKQRWKRPKGIDSKMRLGLRGYAKIIKVGYKSPAKVRGLDKSGLLPIQVHTEKELRSLDKTKHSAIIGSTVSQKNKVKLLVKAKELGLHIGNVRDAEAFFKSVEEDMKERKEARKKRKAKKEEKKEKKEKKDKLADKVLSEEEKAEADKKEKDKLLTKKEAL